ncbi:ROK family protein [Lederbergia sp. NSJ-179]|uniref:ROK family protein n=1 Tax=Lederbergia sp. NSJ-179 TaxID=2931402 RepID=UPI001FD11A91|nr:ROK family protein [Lederbergia sp. NSJ-179]MCJ7839836.1 ROK family protein [Lederbergia sp. NSJ-179]
MQKGFVGVDIGGTNTVIGLFDQGLGLLEKRSIPTLKPNFPKKTDNPKEFFDVLAQEIQEIIANHDSIHKVDCVGIGVPGKVDPEFGVAINAVNLGYRNVPFAEEMKRRLNLPTFIDNDVRTYTRGEAEAGAGAGLKNVICVTLGTGMAAGIMIDGKMIPGSDYFAGEIGHDPVQGNETLCNCGKIGCLETIASASGISRLAKEAVQSGKKTILHDLSGEISSKDVFEASVTGDKVAIEVFKEVATVLGYKLLTATFLLNPEVIIIGGGVAAAGHFITDPINEIFVGHYNNEKMPLIATGELGDSAGLIGAALLAREKLYK